MPYSHYYLQKGLIDLPFDNSCAESFLSYLYDEYKEDKTFVLLRSLTNELVNLPDFLKLNIGDVPQNLRELVKNVLTPVPNLNSELTAGFEAVIDKHLLHSADGPAYIQKLSDLCGQILSDSKASVGGPNSPEPNDSNNS